jgi:uncharacterized membrane protein YraQ (UPF0718 family)
VDQNTITDFIVLFLGIVWEALPFIIVGAVIAGVLEELLPQEALGKLLPKHFVPAVMIGGALGLIFPMCECGIVVVMRRLLRKGLPLSCCVAYMLAGPILNVIVLGSTAVAFFPHQLADESSLGPPMLILRAGLGYLVACVTGFIVHALDKRSKRTDLLTARALPPKPTVSLGMAADGGTPPAEPKRTVRERLNNITATALNDFIDITVFLIIGSVIAALVKSDVNLVKRVEEMSQQQPLLAIPLMMGLAFVLCLCSEADAFLAASFTKMSVSGKVAFLVFGPMLDIKLLLMYTRVFRPKLIVVIVSCVALQTFVYTSILHQFYNPAALGSGKKDAPASVSQPGGTPPTSTPPTLPSK